MSIKENTVRKYIHHLMNEELLNDLKVSNDFASNWSANNLTLLNSWIQEKQTKIQQLIDWAYPSNIPQVIVDVLTPQGESVTGNSTDVFVGVIERAINHGESYQRNNIGTIGTSNVLDSLVYMSRLGCDKEHPKLIITISFNFPLGVICPNEVQEDVM